MTGERRQRTRIAINDQLSVIVTDDGSQTLYDEVVGESFHSESGAESESRTVFLENSGVQENLKLNRPTRVLEIGFGVGLNFLFTANVALSLGNVPLEYVGIDVRFPFSAIRHVGSNLIPQFESIRLCEEYNVWFASQTEIGIEFQRVWRFAEPSRLLLWQGDARSCCSDLIESGERFGFIYHDAFSPATSPELWTEEFFRTEFELMLPGGTLSTYCVKREIQDRLRRVGFQIRKMKGPAGGKREVLTATRPN
ncbi:MAG: tRNA (5-methylaminomethyl-2-thiouridine)(34)-methyltransferase MnmD [Pirellulaceae bacterium]